METNRPLDKLREKIQQIGALPQLFAIHQIYQNLYNPEKRELSLAQIKAYLDLVMDYCQEVKNPEKNHYYVKQTNLVFPYFELIIDNIQNLLNLNKKVIINPFENSYPTNLHPHPKILNLLEDKTKREEALNTLTNYINDYLERFGKSESNRKALKKISPLNGLFKNLSYSILYLPRSERKRIINEVKKLPYRQTKEQQKDR